MAFYIEHLGLDFLFDSKEIEDAFINYVVQKGTQIIGYDNMIYFNKHLGTAQIIISGKAQEQDGKKCIELQDISTHCSGIAVWKFRKHTVTLQRQKKLNDKVIESIHRRKQWSRKTLAY